MYAFFVVYRAYVVYAVYVCIHVYMYAWRVWEWFHWMSPSLWHFCQDVISTLTAYPFPTEANLELLQNEHDKKKAK